MDPTNSYYFPLGPEANFWGVGATGTGWAKIKPHEAYPPSPHPVDHMFSWEKGRTLPSFQIILISQGEGEFENKRTGSIEVKEADALVLFPGEWHRYRPEPSSGWTEYWIEFEGHVPRTLLDAGQISPDQAVFAGASSPTLIGLFEEALRLGQAQRPGFSGSIGLIGLNILNYLLQCGPSGWDVSQVAEEKVMRAKELISCQIGQPLLMQDLAENLGLPYSTFRRVFKQLTGYTPKQYQVQMRQRRAQELLANTDMTLTQIAESLGFDSQFHFSADFKRHNRRPPHLWRAQLGSNTLRSRSE